MMKCTAVILGVSLFFSTATFASHKIFPTSTQHTITGTYECTAFDKAVAATYHSQLVITQDPKNMNIYHLVWSFTDKDKTYATGFLQSLNGQAVLSAVYHSARQAPGVAKPDHNGLISYIVKDRHLTDGKWLFVDSEVIGSENCAQVTS